MKILLTGINGFYGQTFYHAFKDEHILYTPTHKELDLLDFKQVYDYLQSHPVDCILHTAVIISRRNKLVDLNGTYSNLLMFENLFCATQLLKTCQKFFAFGSGAELGWYLNKPIINAPESNLYKFITPEYGGFSKSIITKRMMLSRLPHCYNLRVAGCFGYYERDDRFIKSNLLRALNNEPLLIHQNRKMDFYYINDMITLIKHILNNNYTYNMDINCSYSDKYTLYNIAEMILDITHKRLPIIVEKAGAYDEYTINCEKLNSFQLLPIGLKNGIKEMYLKMKG